VSDLISGPRLTTVSGPDLAVRTCARRLSPLGVKPVAGPDGWLTLDWGEAPAGAPSGVLDCRISWFGPSPMLAGLPGSERAVQALCGLMQLHGRDGGRPRPLGLEVTSVAAGLLAATGLLAAEVGRLRHRRVAAVETSVLQAGLLSVSHYLAAATCFDEWVPAPPAAGEGPPFRTADDQWFEMETLDPEVWKAFWLALGAPLGDLGRAWTLFRSRYYRGVCTLPPSLHDTTGRYTLGELAKVAESHGVSVVGLRDYAAVLADLGPDPGHPLVETVAPEGPEAPLAGLLPGLADDPEGLPLAGLRVVEATNRMQGPLAGLLLSMLGAEVTKVEPPGGDIGRGVPPLAGDIGSFFQCFNRGKNSVEIDLSSPGGRAALFDLAAEADVFLHNWRPGKARQWGLEAADLSAANPGIVYVQASGWGAGSPASHLVGTDFLVQAHVGTGHGLNPDGEPPFPSRVVLVDFMGALVTCEGILGGLYRRHRSGHGCRVDTSLLAGAMALQAHVLDELADGRENGRSRGRPRWGPLDYPLPTAEGYLALSVDHESLARLCRVCGVDPAHNGGAGVEQRVAEYLAEVPGGLLEEALMEAGVAYVLVPGDADVASVAADARISHLLVPLAGTSVAPASPWRFGL